MAELDEEEAKEFVLEVEISMLVLTDEFAEFTTS